MYSFGEYWFSKSPHSVIKSVPLMEMLRSSATVRKCSRLVGHTIHLRFVADGFYRYMHFMHFHATDLQYRGLLHPLRHLRLLQPSRATVRKCSRRVGHTIHLRFVSGGFCYDVNPPTSLCVVHTCTHTYLYTCKCMEREARFLLDTAKTSDTHGYYK